MTRRPTTTGEEFTLADTSILPEAFHVAAHVCASCIRPRTLSEKLRLAREWQDSRLRERIARGVFANRSLKSVAAEAEHQHNFTLVPPRSPREEPPDFPRKRL